MKIINYIFLLFILALLAATVHVSTQKNEFELRESYFIHAPKNQVYTFLNDCRNWQTFSYWKQTDPEQVFTFPANTIGAGGYCAWEGNDESGKLITTKSLTNQLIIQKLRINNKGGSFSWTLKDSLQGTVLTWQYNGAVSFKTKVNYALKGGVTQGIQSAMKATLAKLDRIIQYELNTFRVDLQGVTKKKGCFYLGESINCKTQLVEKNIRILLPRMLRFFYKNKLAATGAPFVIYHAYDYPKGYSKISVCLPIKDSIFTSPGSQITSGVLAPFSCYSTRLKGDYRHLSSARKKTRSYLDKNHIQENLAVPPVEVYTKSSSQIANPSKWVTDLYFPIKPIQRVIIPISVPDSTATLR
jgi:hypothetical protein